MGFTQRQAAGRFTRDEADDFIRRLEGDETEPARAPGVPEWRRSAQEQVLGCMAAEELAGELRRRGWMVIEPLTP